LFNFFVCPHPDRIEGRRYPAGFKMERKVAVMRAYNQILKKDFLSHLYKVLIFSKNFANNLKESMKSAP
jgi:hypothetical protein